MKTVYMRQVGRYRWQLESEHGKILLDDLSMASAYHAETWAKSYVSSFQCWALVIKPIEEKIDAKP